MDYPKRKSMRLKNYDYTQNGIYFVTIATFERIHKFGNIVGEGFHPLPSLQLSPIGIEVQKSIEYMNNQYDCVDKYVIMPNHIHLLIQLKGQPQETSLALSDIIGRMKSYTTLRYNQINHTKALHLWQRTYHDHVIREPAEYQEIWQYIEYNPLKWAEDCYFSE